MRATRAAMVALVATIGLASVACTPPPPTQTLDQEFDPSSVNLSAGANACSLAYEPTTDYRVAQTFTAGKTGLLDQVGLKAQWANVGGYPDPAPLVLSIQTVEADGRPSGVEIGSGNYAGPASSSVITAIPLSTPASVVQGEQYAVVLSESTCLDPPPYYGWEFKGSSSSVDGYTAGGAWRSNSFTASWVPVFSSGYTDLVFRTWVT